MSREDNIAANAISEALVNRWGFVRLSQRYRIAREAIEKSRPEEEEVPFTELRSSVAIAAWFCRQRRNDGNIAFMTVVGAVRALGEEVVGAEEFSRWENWTAPLHVMVDRALNGGEPG